MQDIDSYFTLLEKFTSEGVSEEEKKILRAHFLEFYRKIDWSALSVSRSLIIKKLFPFRHLKNKLKKVGPRILMRLGAFLLLFVLCLAIIHRICLRIEKTRLQQSRHLIWTASGERKKVFLSDSSSLWMEPSTVIRIADSASLRKRIIYLRGAAFFHINHPRLAPYVLSTDSFSLNGPAQDYYVSAYPNRPSEIALLKGSMSVTTHLPIGKIVHIPLHGFQNLSFNGTLDFAHPQPLLFAGDYVLHYKGIFNYRATPLWLVIDDIRRNYKVPVDMDPLVAGKLFTGSMHTTQSIDSILSRIAIRLKVKVRRIDATDSYIVSSTGFSNWPAKPKSLAKGMKKKK